MLGIVTGLRAEADLARKFFPQALIAMSCSTSQGAAEAVCILKAQGAERILSFGCAGALSPGMRVGDILLPKHIVTEEKVVPVSFSLFSPTSGQRGQNFSRASLFAAAEVIETPARKKKLFEKYGTAAVDMESAAAAGSLLPFGVLRVICDTAEDILPPAACLPLSEKGEPRLGLIFASLLKNPFQLTSLLKLGSRAFLAHRAMEKFLRHSL